MIKAMFPGNFDPVTFGHINIVARAASMFDHLDVVVSVNPTKQPLFSTEERVLLMKKFCAEYANITVTHWEGLVVDYAKNNDIKIMVRGLRPLSDFAYEFEMATVNHQINPFVETLFIPTEAQYAVQRSSALKEMAYFGADISNFAPAEVVAMVKQKLAG